MSQDYEEVVRQRCIDLYGEGELADAVYAHSSRLGTIKRIANGNLHLPSKEDAQRWFDQAKARGLNPLDPEA